MGKVIQRQIKALGLKAKILLVTCLTLLLTVGIYQVWKHDADAALVNSQAWSSVYAGTAFPGSYTYTVPAGSERLLVVAVQSTVTAAATQTCTVTWGGKSLTQAQGDGTTSAQAHTYLFYLKEADIAAASGTSLAVSVTGGTTSYNMVRAAVYTGVEQSAPVASKGGFSSGATAVTTVGPLSPTLTIATGNQAIEIVNLSRTGSTTSRTITVATPWSTLLTSATGSGTGTIGVRNYLFGDTTAATGVNGQWTASGTTLASSSAIVLTAKLPTSLSVTGTAIEPTGHRLDTDTGVLMQRLAVTGSGPIELSSLTLNDLGTTSALASAEIYVSPTLNPALPADAVLLASATNWGGTSTVFSLTGGTQANRSLGGTQPLTKYIYVVYDFSAGTALKTAQSTVTAVGVVSPNTGWSGTGLTSNVVTLDYSGNQLSTVAGNNGASTAKDSDVAVVMQHFQVTCDSAFDNSLQVNSITMQDLGTNGDATGVGVSAVKIYVAPTEDADPTKLPANAVLVGQLKNWDKSSTTIALTDDLDLNANQGVARTVFAGTPKYVYVVYSMYYRDNPDYFANKDVTSQSKVTAIGVSSPDVGQTGLSYTSNVVALTRGTWSKITNCGSCHETTNIKDNPTRAVVTDTRTLPDGTSYQDFFGRYPGSHSIHTNTDKLGYACTTCHADHQSPTLVFNHANGVIDFSGQLAGDKYTRSSGNKAPVINGTYAFGTCNNTACHGVQSAAWATDMSAVAQCDKCHSGTPASSNPFKSTGSATANTDNHAGAHTSHINAAHGIAAPLACSACHPNVTAITTAGHMNGTVDFNTANLITYAGSGLTCSTGTACHVTKLVPTQNVAAKWNTPFMTGDKANDCTLCHAMPPNTAGHPQVVKDDYAANGFSSCGGCHDHLNGDGTFNNLALHLNGKDDISPSKGGKACGLCHTFASIMTGDATTYHHVLVSSAVDYNAKTCLQCHVDHDIFQVAQNGANTIGVSANLRVSTSVTPAKGAPGVASGYTNTDYVAGSEGICVSCHKSVQTKNMTAQKGNGDTTINTTTLVVTDSQFSGSAHNYTAASTFTKDSSQFNGNCSKCHNDSFPQQYQNNTAYFSTHQSQTRELFNSFGNATPIDAREQLLCIACHSTQGQKVDAQTGKPTANKDWYGSQAMRASAEDTFTSFSTSTRVFRHNVGKYTAKHKAGEDQTYISANKHVECADCHNSHSASYGNHTLGSATLASALAGATGLAPTWPAGGSYTTTPSSTLYLRNTNAINTVPPTRPGAYQVSSGTYTTTTFTQRDMSPTSGATSATTNSATGTTAARYNRALQFVSPQIDNAVTIPTNSNFNLTIQVGRTTTTSTGYPRFVVYKWSGGTATLLNTTAAPNNYAQSATAIANPAANQTWTFTSNTAVTLNPGDALVCEVEYYLTTAPATTQNDSFTYGNGTTYALALPTGTYNWRTAAPAPVWATASSYAPGAATQEYQICLKCHSAANTSYASWGGTGAAAWTDLAIEFNPNNASRHPIGTPLVAGSQLLAARLNNGWTPGMTMNCTDCHATDSTASKGPHGSAVKWMLAGTNKAWPYTSAAQNGTATAVTNSNTFRIANYNTNSGTVNGLFCLNCHPVTGTNNWHTNGNVTGGQHGGSGTAMSCVSCHLRVPHGGKIGRLRATTNAGTRYGATGNSAPTFSSFPPVGTAPANGNFKCSSTTQHSGGTEAW